jgi:cation-transporting ATPase 13A3/4/5
VASLENFAIFSVSQFQYIILVVVFSKGAPYRESIFKNKPLLVDMTILVAFSLFLTLGPEAWPNCKNYFMLLPPPNPSGLNYRLFLVGMAGANLLLALFTEVYLSDVLVRRAVASKDAAHELVSRELAGLPDWPPLSPPAPSSPEEEPYRPEGRGVTVTETDPARPSDQAFNSLFNTPNSSIHSAAAVSLNPPQSTPRWVATVDPPHPLPRRQAEGRPPAAELALASPCREAPVASPARSFSTAQPSPASSAGPAVRQATNPTFLVLTMVL